MKIHYLLTAVYLACQHRVRSDFFSLPAFSPLFALINQSIFLHLRYRNMIKQNMEERGHLLPTMFPVFKSFLIRSCQCYPTQKPFYKLRLSLSIINDSGYQASCIQSVRFFSLRAVVINYSFDTYNETINRKFASLVFQSNRLLLCATMNSMIADIKEIKSL